MFKVNEIIDLRDLSWSKTRQSSGTAGSYLKSYSFYNGKKIYYKLSYFDDINGVFGYEAFNEIIADRILDLLHYNHLKYNLICARIIINGKEYTTFLNSSFDFKNVNETKMTFENFYEINKFENEDVISFCERYNFIQDIYHMIIIDYLIMNRDRHGANIEVLYNSKTKKYRLAPLFDHGLSLLSPTYKNEEIKKFDIYLERKVNSYICSSSLENNLKMVPSDIYTEMELDFDYIFKDIVNEDNYDYMEKAKALLIWRWKKLEDIFNKK